MENKYYEMNIAGCIRRLPRIRITDSMEIASFVLLGDAELVVKAAAELVKKVPEVDYLITAEAKGIPLIQEMARILDMKRYFVARKSVKPYMIDPLCDGGIFHHYTEKTDPLSGQGREQYDPGKENPHCG